MTDPLMTVEDVAQLLALPTSTVYEQLRKGIIPGRLKIGRRVRISRAALEAWIERQIAEQAATAH